MEEVAAAPGPSDEAGGVSVPVAGRSATRQPGKNRWVHLEWPGPGRSRGWLSMCVFILAVFRITSFKNPVTDAGVHSTLSNPKSHHINVTSTPLEVVLHPPVHVAFGLSGNHSGFLSEFAIALKSVLLNAPLERSLFVHVLADRGAIRALGNIFSRLELARWVTRNPVEVRIYDMTPLLPSLESRIMEAYLPSFPSFNLKDGIQTHTIGAFFRLFAHRVIAMPLTHLLYMDTDVVMMTNLDELWRLVEINPDALFHWGSIMCSGFLVMNVPRMEEIWSLAKNSSMKVVADRYDQSQDDQLIFMAVNVSHPAEVNILPDGWAMTVTEHWKVKYQPYDYKFPNVGMLHFNGGGKNKESYAVDNNFFKSFPDTWGNGKYYTTLPWTWARYHAKSIIRPDSTGHVMNIVNCADMSLWNEIVSTKLFPECPLEYSVNNSSFISIGSVVAYPIVGSSINEVHECKDNMCNAGPNYAPGTDSGSSVWNMVGHCNSSAVSESIKQSA